MKLLRTTIALASAIVLAVPVGSAAFAAPPSGNEDIPKALAPYEVADAPNTHRYLVTLKNEHGGNTKAHANERLREQAYRLAGWRQKYGMTVHRQLSFLANAFSATMTPAMAAKLRQEPSVLRVEEQQKFYPQENHARLQQGLSAALENGGLDGRGMVVAVVDTGIDPSHPDLTLSDDDCKHAAIKNIKPGFTCKVPFGHNYADENENTVDVDPHPHGQHVAGIVGANGKVKGMAPKAQLLAMKVFSNHEDSGAWDVDIYAAVEDAVKLGADVINMSLGSDNGVFIPSETGAQVLDAARAAGVLPVISAGNSGQNFSEDGRLGNERGQVDDSTLGSPGSFPAAFTVASVENNKNTDYKATVQTAAGDSFEVSYSHSFGTRDNSSHELVDVGEGEKADYKGVDVTGKYAFMARTDNLSYKEKAKYAKDAGAAGIVAFNRPKGGDHTFTLYDVEADYPLVGVGLRRDEGLKVREALAKGKAEITLSEELRVTDSPDTGKASDFTSWGGPADLSFKPEIAGVGGFIYSLANGTGYGNMSGTSMSSPNIAGLSALAIQRIREKHPEMSKQDALAWAENLIINTAQVLRDGDVPLPVRRIGSGLAQIDRVVSGDVTATVDGDAALALREISGPRTVTVTLTNKGQKERSFSIPTPTVYREAVRAGQETKLVEAESTFTAGAGQVTVPAGGTATVDFTLQPAGAQGSFLEGWLNFKSGSAEQPDLQVPYYGFYGDWSAEPMFATRDNLLSEELPNQYSGLITSIPSLLGPRTLRVDGAADRPLAISPNGDQKLDTVSPLVTLLRNLHDYSVTVTDANGTELRTVGLGEAVRRATLSGALERPSSANEQLSEFDGQIWNVQKGEMENLPDGAYNLRVDGRMLEGGKPQSISFPFEIDTVAPEISFGDVYEEDEKRYVDVTITDSGSGVFVTDDPDTSAVEFYNNGSADDKLDWEFDGEKTYKVELLDDTVSLTVAAADYGLNEAHATKLLSDGSFTVSSEEELTSEVLGNKYGVKDGKLALTGFVGESVAGITANGTEATVQDGTWKVAVPVVDGDNTITLVSTDADGKELDKKEITVKVDAFAPEFSEMNWDEEHNFTGNADGTATISGRVTQKPSKTDPHHDGKLIVRVSDVFGDVAESTEVGGDGSFSFEVDTNDMLIPLIELVADDGANETGTLSIINIPDENSGDDTEESGPVTWSLSDDIYCEGGFLCLVEPSYKGLKLNPDGTASVVLEGEGTPGLHLAFTARGGLSGNDYVYPAPIETDITSDGKFQIEIPLNKEMLTRYRVVATKDGEPVSEKVLTFLRDTENVSLHFETPQLLDGSLFINSANARIPFTGWAADNGFYYNVAINSDTVAEMSDLSSAGEKHTKRLINYTSRKLNNGDTVLVTTDDVFGNAQFGAIPVVLDDVKPTITGAGQQRLHLQQPQTLKFTAADKYLTQFTLLVDGKPANTVAREGLNVQNIEDVLQDAPAATPTADDTAADSADDASAGRAANADAAAAQTAPKALSASERQAVRSAATAEARAAARSTRAVTAAARSTRAVTAADEATLELSYDTSALASGNHKLVLEARDFAGNVTYDTLDVLVDQPATIAGPDVAELTVPAADQNDQKKLAELVLAQYKIADPDGAYGLDGQPANGETSVALAEGTMLFPGTNKVKLIGTDAAGNTITREVTVNLTVQYPAQPGDGAGGQPGADGSGAGGSGGAAAGEQGAKGAKGAKGALATTGTPAGYSLAVALLLVALGVVGLSAATDKRRREA